MQAAQSNGVAPADLTSSRPRPEYIPGRIDDPGYVRIFDTTLRDGEQSPGATLTEKEKLDIARMLHKLGVDIIEAGFPVASPGDFAAVRQIAEEVGNNVDSDGFVPVICGLSRTKVKDLEVRRLLSDTRCCETGPVRRSCAGIGCACMHHHPAASQHRHCSFRWWRTANHHSDAVCLYRRHGTQCGWQGDRECTLSWQPHPST